MLKRCSYCRCKKDVSEFYKNSRAKDGLYHRCISCHRALKKEHHIKNKEKDNAYSRKWAKENPERNKIMKIEYAESMIGKYKHWKQSAIKRNLLWELSIEDLEKIPKICHYTNVNLTMEINKPNTVSLDRVDSSKGYIKDNVVFCCKTINFLKNNLSLQKLIKFCDMVHNNRERILNHAGKT